MAASEKLPAVRAWPVSALLRVRCAQRTGQCRHWGALGRPEGTSRAAV